MHERLADGELAVEGKLLRHVADTGTGNSGFRCSGLSTKNQNFTGIEAAPADDAAELVLPHPDAPKSPYLTESKFERRRSVGSGV